MATEIRTFIECTSVSLSYDIMGLVTISYTLITNDTEDPVKAWSVLQFGFKEDDSTHMIFRGYVTSVNTVPIPETSGWYENHVQLIALTE